MIFFFSATGNSRYTAEKIASAVGDTLVDIGDAYKRGQFEYDISRDEYLGFVLPTFAWTLPGIAAMFIEKLKLTGVSESQYVFGVFTCGESSGFESAAIRTLLDRRGIHFNGSFDLVMPDNFILWSSLPEKDSIEKALDSADAQLDGIIEQIRAKIPGKIDTAPPKDLYMKTAHISTAAGTSKFFADESCVSCGLCERLCPMSCIKPGENRMPVWEGECTMCLSCLHRCPKAAIQHGTDTQGKARYVNTRTAINQ